MSLRSLTHFLIRANMSHLKLNWLIFLYYWRTLILNLDWLQISLRWTFILDFISLNSVLWKPKLRWILIHNFHLCLCKLWLRRALNLSNDGLKLFLGWVFMVNLVCFNVCLTWLKLLRFIFLWPLWLKK